jgi:hypothetical protein
MTGWTCHNITVPQDHQELQQEMQKKLMGEN